MKNITKIREFMLTNGLKYLLVNATNEFLVEYNTLDNNSRYKLTGFSGSTGEALVTPETIYLFVDGRYHIQADLEVNHDLVTVIKLQTGQKFSDILFTKIPKDETLGIFAKKITQKMYETIQEKCKTKLLEIDPLDNDKNNNTPSNTSLDIKYTGLSAEEKATKLSQNLSLNQAIYLTDLDEVSYIFNMRDFSQVFSAKIKAKAIILKDNAILFTQDKLENLSDFLKSLNKEILVDKSKINAYDYNLIKDKAKELISNPVQIMKAEKTDAEIEHLKSAFNKTDNAMKAIREYILNSGNISEYDIAVKLAHEFKNQGALGLSFNSIVAKDKNSALAHYSKSSKDEIITDGSLILIDCGGYFEGGLATDITRVFVKGEPTQLHKKIYTLVLKAFLQAYNFTQTHSNDSINGFEIDQATREFFNTQDCEGFIFNHGLGHGIGINVHEYPPSLSPSELAKTPIKDGMCFSIEPGLYKEGLFGIRLENSCYFKDNKIHSFVKMNYESKLINFEMLSETEKEQLKEFEVI
ncbi:MAG: M24 family metallopeptidase [Cyanobacteria bacterium SIG26]|nr:M24 family metallopeptidase [Cyanobacteria bacterium SIG26]